MEIGVAPIMLTTIPVLVHAGGATSCVLDHPAQTSAFVKSNAGSESPPALTPESKPVPHHTSRRLHHKVVLHAFQTETGSMRKDFISTSDRALGLESRGS